MLSFDFETREPCCHKESVRHTMCMLCALCPEKNGPRKTCQNNFMTIIAIIFLMIAIIFSLYYEKPFICNGYVKFHDN